MVRTARSVLNSWSVDAPKLRLNTVAHGQGDHRYEWRAARHREAVNPREPMERANEVLVTIETGVEGDCHGSVPDRQVTVISADSWRDACQYLGMEVSWTKRRANLVLGGIDLRDTEGAPILIGDVLLEIAGEKPGLLECRRASLGSGELHHKFFEKGQRPLTV